MGRPKPIAATEPLYWARPEYSPQDIRAAWRAAQGGDLRLAAELSEAMLADDRISATIGVRVRGLLGLPLAFEPANNREGKTIARNLEADFWEFAPEDALYSLISWGLLVGVGLARLDWQQSEETGRVLPRLEVWHPRALRFDYREGVWRIQTNEGTEIVPQPGQWWLYTPYGDRAPWRFGLWRALAIPWLVKYDAIRYWARDNEVGALRVGKASGPVTPEARAQLARDLAELGSDTAIALPEGYDLSILSPSGDVWRSKEAAISWADTAITVTVLGQNLTTQVQGGSFAAARVHDSVRHDLLESDAETLSTSLRENVIAWWAEFNYGSSRLAPWPRWDTTPPADRQAEADTLNKIASAIATLKNAGAPVDVSALLQAYGIPLATQEPVQTVRLASGDRVPASSGFVQGQLYVDALADRSLERVRVPLEVIQEAIDQAEDYPQLRELLWEKFSKLSPEQFGEVMEKALVLANLAGRLAVLEEANVEG